MKERLAETDPARESVFRQAYRRGWLAATDALAQLCEERGLPVASAAQVLRKHHADALARWEGDGLGVGFYPPKVSVRRAKVNEEERN